MGSSFERELLAGLEQPEATQLDLGQAATRSVFPHQVEAILASAWDLAGHDLGQISDVAAWQIAWQRLEASDYAAAAEWLDRVRALPKNPSQHVQGQHAALLRVCRTLERLIDESQAAGDQASSSSARSPQLPQLTVTNLGGFQVQRGDAMLPICRARKPIALLRYLLSRSQRAAHREEIMEALWPNAKPGAAAHSLHVAVSTLRRYLDPQAESYLLFAAGQYSITCAAVIEDDSRAFLHMNAEADRFWHNGDWQQARQAYSKAIGSYQGDYHVDDQDLTWAVAERERLLSRYLLALERLGSLWMRQQEFDAAAEYYQRLLERDTYREDIYCKIISCYLNLGRRSDALLLYQRCVSILANDLGLEPMLELQNLYRSIIGAESS